MEVVMSTQSMSSLFASLGCPIGDTYIVGDDCQATLQEILKRLQKEDKYVRGFRCLIANSQVIKKDLLPLLYSVKNDYKILDLIIEILENLMIPVECLFPIDIMIKEDAGRSTICRLNWLLTACKEAFLNPCATKSVIDYIKLVTKKQPQLNKEGANTINLCLKLLRNLLHIPEVRGGAPGGGASHQNQIIWNLFTQNIDKVILQLMTSNGRTLWCETMLQLISLLYKDQNSNTILKLLKIWCDTALSESSEDDESNTSPQDRGSGDSSSSMNTSDTPNSDSSDSDHHKHKTKEEGDTKHQLHSKQAAQNRMTEILANGIGRKAQVAMRNKHGNSKNTHPTKLRHPEHIHAACQELHNPVHKELKMFWGSESGLGSSIGGSDSAGDLMKMECGSIEMSESGCEMQNQETISTSSNEDKEPARFGKKKPVHQKPLHMIQKSRYYNGKVPLTARRDLHREKLMKRSKTSTMSIKTFLNHTPSEDDISQLLKEFTIDFLLKGYGHLVSELKNRMLTNKDVQMDTSHFTWLIMFFLKFATQLELDLQLISPVLSFNIVSYLTYEGVNLCEELEVAKLQAGENLTMILQKLYLSVSSLKEIVLTIENYKKMGHLSQNDRDYLRKLQEKMAFSKDLRHLFVLLLRHFDPHVQSQQYLEEVIVTNHHFLILLESFSSVTKTSVAEHIKMFATEDVMKQYGVLLTFFETNGEMVNNCIFTMMHHIAGDLEKVSVLFQPTILSSFTRILQTDFQLSDDWSDLVEYVIQKCLKPKQVKGVVTSSFHLNGNELEVKPPSSHSQTTQSSVEHSPPINQWNKEELENLCWYFPQCIESQDVIGHIKQLFLENCGLNKSRIEIIENLHGQGLIIEEDYHCLMERENSSKNHEIIQNNNTHMDFLEGIQVIVEYLHGENLSFFLKWLQNSLLEACYAKLVLNGQQTPKYDLEPVAYYYTMLGQPVPLVTWDHELWKVMQLEPSIWLLSALNFHLPMRAGQARIFARIPSEWTADHLYVVALILGSIESRNVKFEPSELDVMKQTDHSSTSKSQPTTINNHLQEGSSLFAYELGSSTSAEWFQKIKQLKAFPKTQPHEDRQERMSLISGDERDWDLISMCVSDEGARHDTSVLQSSLR